MENSPSSTGGSAPDRPVRPLPLGIADEHPAQGYRRHATVVPDGSRRGEFHRVLPSTIPRGNRHAHPRGCRVGGDPRQGWRVLPLVQGSPDLARPLQWRWGVPSRVQAKAGDHRHRVRPRAAGGEQLEGDVRTVGHRDHGAFRLSAPHGPQHLARPVGQRLVPPPTGPVVALGGRRGRQEGQSPRSARPRDRHEQHDADPAPPARLDEVGAGGAHWIPVDPFGCDLGAAAPRRPALAHAGRSCVHIPRGSYLGSRATTPHAPDRDPARRRPRRRQCRTAHGEREGQGPVCTGYRRTSLGGYRGLIERASVAAGTLATRTGAPSTAPDVGPMVE